MFADFMNGVFQNLNFYKTLGGERGGSAVVFTCLMIGMVKECSPGKASDGRAALKCCSVYALHDWYFQTLERLSGVGRGNQRNYCNVAFHDWHVQKYAPLRDAGQ